MKNLGNALKKPVVLWSIIGILTLTDIGLKKQNNYLFDKHIEMSKEYPALAYKYHSLNEQKFRDSMMLLNKYSSEKTSLMGDKLELAYRLDSLFEASTSSTERLKGFLSKFSFEMDSLQKDYSEAYEEFFNKILLIKDENDFYKKHLHYLDSLLFKCESNKTLQDRR